MAFSHLLEQDKEAYNAERQEYVDLLKKRSDLFLQQAQEVGLKHYPYKEGFFVTLAMDNATRDAFHQALIDQNIFTVKVNKGIRVAICSMPVAKVDGLAPRMKTILDTIIQEA